MPVPIKTEDISLTESGLERLSRSLNCVPWAELAVVVGEQRSRSSGRRETLRYFGQTVYIWHYTPWQRDHWGEPYFVYEIGQPAHSVPTRAAREELTAALTAAAIEVGS